MLINHTCISLVDCSSYDNSCTLQCNNTALAESDCVIEGDIAVNSSISNITVISIVGVINVTGDVTISGGNFTLVLTPGSALHVGNCLVLDDESQMVIVVDNEISDNDNILATFNPACSSQLTSRVQIQTSLDECQDGKPIVEQRQDTEYGRGQLQLVFVPVECGSKSSELNVVAISVAVPIAALAVAAIVVVMLVPKLRQKVFPFANRK